ncbi:GxGYxYP domain-containing protein [Paenibacillus sp. FJAT-27812]|uniref:GxGYxYP domain-containing protein n=1 Tax=Paenibacillus sp. FJAT-27812 TaxID=1684143 RepID=UPI0006A7DF75|nr:GxGYxYP domain-containing protein [Paenibacillus sp. FJAT-27812]
MTKTRKRASSAIALLLAAMIILSGCQKTASESESIFPQLTIAKHLYVIKGDDLKEEEWVLAETLQGIVAQEQAEIYIDNGNAYTVWLEDMKASYGITYEYVQSVWDLVDKFKGKLNENGFVQFKRSNTSTVNAASTVSGAMKYVAVEESLADAAVQHGLVKKLDVSDKDEMWALTEYGDKLNKDFIFKQAYSLNSLRDYGAAVKGLYMYDASLAEMKEAFDWTNPNSAIMGWHSDELSGVDTASRLGKMTIASDHAHNLSVFSALPREQLKQKKTKKNARDGEKVHYVTFIMSDGDNVQWYVNGAPLASKMQGHKDKGKVPFGWSIAPSLADLAPNLMKYSYEKATENDYFVAAVSGIGYINPSLYPEETLKRFMKDTNAFMKRADLKYVSILDNEISQDVIDQYAAQDQIEGGFYFMGYKYGDGKGALSWSNGKPFIAARETLWETEPLEMAVRLNSYKKDPSVIEGYTMVNVHPWSHNYQDVLDITANLGPDVVVVTPDEFMELIKKNVKQENVSELDDVTSFDYSAVKKKLDEGIIDLDEVANMAADTKYIYTFDKDSEGWEAVDAGKEYDKAGWFEQDGNGFLQMDGSDLGKKDLKPNGYFYKKLLLPTGKVTMSFDIKSKSSDHDGDFQIEIIQEDQSITTLAPWETIKTGEWTAKTVDLSAFAGKAVTILLEQSDSGQGDGEYIHLDNLKITSN